MTDVPYPYWPFWYLSQFHASATGKLQGVAYAMKVYQVHTPGGIAMWRWKVNAGAVMSEGMGTSQAVGMEQAITNLHKIISEKQ